MVPFATFSNIWEKADGPYEYARIYKIFTFNDEFYVSENSDLDYTYKYHENGWDRLDTGFFAGKGTVSYFDQNEEVIFTTIGRKMYLSYDAGKNWRKFDTLGGNVSYSSVAIVGSTIFLQAHEFACLHKLEKGSDTLETIYLSDSKSDSIFADKIISNGDYMFAADLRDHFNPMSGEGKFYISKDKGNTWNLSQSMKKQIKNLLFYNNTLLAFTNDNGLNISKDYGETWTSDPTVNLEVSKVITYKNKIFACGKQINISTDNGVSWEVSKNNGLDRQSCKDILVNKDTLYYLIDYGSVVFYSTDAGNQWIRKTPFTDDFRQSQIIEYQDTLFSVGNLTINYSIDKGKTWAMYSDSLYYNYTILSKMAIRDSIFIAVDQWGNFFYISTDYGRSWRSENLGNFDSNGWIGSILIMGNRILLTSSKFGNYISKDAGLNWEKYENGVLKSDSLIYNYFRLNDLDIILYGTSGLYKSNNNGLSWEYEKTDSLIHVSYYSYRDGNIIYQMDFINNIIYKSTDLGRTWITLELQIEPDLYWRQIIPYNGSVILLTKTDVFVSDNDGKDWRKHEINILRPNGKDLYFTYGIVSDDYLVLASDYGIWRAKLSDLGIVKSSVEAEIERNYLYTYPPYPNPANSEVKVLFYWDINLPMATDDISIYDITGKKIDAVGKLSLVKQESHYGNIIWDCSSAQPGIYLMNIKHGTEEKAVKVVVE